MYQLLHECKGYTSNIGIEPEGRRPEGECQYYDVYSPRTRAITSLLHDDVIIVGANISYWHCGQCHILYIGIAVPLNL